jgi:hypothetical protein
MLTSGDLAFLMKNKVLHTPYEKIIFIGTGKRQVDVAYKYLYGKEKLL